MKLRALDQIHVSAVKPDSLRPGEEFEMDDERGAALLKQLPDKFVQIGGAGASDTTEAKAESAPINRAEPAPKNKAGKAK